MNCEKFEHRIIDLYYRDCDKNISEEMQDHLKVCNKCAELYGKVSAILGSVVQQNAAEPDNFYYLRLSAKIKSQKKESKTRVYTWLAQPLVAACLAALGIFIGIRISGNFSFTNTAEEQLNKHETAELQLADEYNMKSDDAELIENYYINDK